MKNYIGYLLLLLALVGLAFAMIFILYERDGVVIGSLILPVVFIILFYLWKNNFFKRNS